MALDKVSKSCMAIFVSFNTEVLFKIDVVVKDNVKDLSSYPTQNLFLHRQGSVLVCFCNSKKSTRRSIKRSR